MVLAAFAGGALTGGFAHANKGAANAFAHLGQYARVLTIVENAYVDPVERDALLRGAIRGMVSELDPHSAYMPKEDYSLFNADTEGQFGGIGVEVELRDGKVFIVRAMANSPAKAAKLGAGDRILAVEGVKVNPISLQKLVKRMRGKVGTEVKLTILPFGAKKERDVVVKRAIIRVASVEGKRLGGDIGYLRVKQFGARTHTEFLQTLGTIRQGSSTPLKGVILDLRSNPGGLVREATAIASEFLDGGVVFTTRQRGKEVERYSAHRGGALLKIPTVVLVNEYSASASELLAGALQDHKAALIVGQNTFGKGSVQTIFDLPGGDGMRLTTMRYYTPAGRGIQARGVIPNIRLHSPRLAKVGDGIVREADLDGHLPIEPLKGVREVKPSLRKLKDKPVPKKPKGPPRPGEERLDRMGVSKNVPADIRKSKDTALVAGYDILLKRIH